MIEMIVNGKERQLDEPTNLLAYLNSLDIKLKNIAVAYNGTVLRKDELSEFTLTAGDKIEIVRAVGGG